VLYGGGGQRTKNKEQRKSLVLSATWRVSWMKKTIININNDTH
jgi:hypothetical protein